MAATCAVYQGSTDERAVVQKLNQGECTDALLILPTGRQVSVLDFFVTFFSKKKVRIIQLKSRQNIRQ